jgi:putative transposase
MLRGSIGGILVGVDGDRTDFFISHAGADRAWAEWVAWELAEAGYTVGLDVWDWAAGRNFVTAMSDALGKCDRVVALFRWRISTGHAIAPRSGRGAEAGERRAAARECDLAGGLGFLRGRARPATADLVMFISEYKECFGVEPACRVLTASGWQIAPGTYYAAIKRPLPARALKDAEILAEIRRMRADYEEVYGARKTWLELNRRGFPVARCTVERVMGRNGLRGAAPACGRR